MTTKDDLRRAEIERYLLCCKDMGGAPRTWEIGAYFYRRHIIEDEPVAKLAKTYGYTKAWVANLIRLEDHLIPEILSAYHETDDSTTRSPSIIQLLGICALPSDEQREVWNEYLSVGKLNLRRSKKTIDKASGRP